jgi:hypothetical protein
MQKLTITVLAVAIGMMGCATSSKDVSSTYVSPLQYQNYDCPQLSLEAQRIQSRVVETGGRLDQAAANDKALVGVGVILFWPALFALGGTKNQEAEFARLKGEYDAVQKVAIEKKCSATTTADAQANTPKLVPVVAEIPAPSASSPK